MKLISIYSNNNNKNKLKLTNKQTTGKNKSTYNRNVPEFLKNNSFCFGRKKFIKRVKEKNSNCNSK